MHHLLVWLLKGDLTAQVLHFAVGLGLYARDLLLFTSSPDFVQITEQSVHECFRDIGGTSIAEVVGNSICFIWDPFIAIFITEPLVRISCVSDFAWFLANLIRRWGLFSWISSIHVPDTRSIIHCELCKLVILRRLSQEG